MKIGRLQIADCRLKIEDCAIFDVAPSCHCEESDDEAISMKEMKGADL